MTLALKLRKDNSACKCLPFNILGANVSSVTFPADVSSAHGVGLCYVELNSSEVASNYAQKVCFSLLGERRIRGNSVVSDSKKLYIRWQCKITLSSETLLFSKKCTFSICCHEGESGHFAETRCNR